eukprot:1079500-Pelagomonas_calceolata.AAC.1
MLQLQAYAPRKSQQTRDCPPGTIGTQWFGRFVINTFSVDLITLRKQLGGLASLGPTAAAIVNEAI